MIGLKNLFIRLEIISIIEAGLLDLIPILSMLKGWTEKEFLGIRVQIVGDLKMFSVPLSQLLLDESRCFQCH